MVILIIAVLLAAGLAGAFYYKKQHHNEAETTSPSKTAQSSYSGGKDRPANGGSTGNSQGGAIDNDGDSGTSTPSEPTIPASTGKITVAGLASGGLLTSGMQLHGTTATDVTQVQFRVIDEEVGVLGQGQLKVVNGSFSGTLQFTPRSDTGRLDVYSFDTAGSEINNIEIPVRFK